MTSCTDYVAGDPADKLNVVSEAPPRHQACIVDCLSVQLEKMIIFAFGVADSDQIATSRQVPSALAD